MNEMQLRSLAVIVRPVLPELLPAGPAATLDGQLAAALGRTPGRARAELRRLLLEDAPDAVHEWVRRRITVATEQVRSAGPGQVARPGVDEHELLTWVEERGEDDDEALVRGESYVLVAMAGVESAASRYAPEVRESTGPGLTTTWVLSSTTVQFAIDSGDPQVGVDAGEAGDETQWLATFTMVIPEVGDSVRRRLRIIPQFTSEVGADVMPQPRIDGVVFAGDDVYRRVTVSFCVRPDPARPPSTPISVDSAPETNEPVSSLVTGRTAAAHSDLRPAAEWQRRERQLLIDVISPSRARVTVQQGGVKMTVNWATGGSVVSRIRQVRESLDKLRQAFPAYFEMIEADQLAADLAKSVPPSRWHTDGSDVAEGFTKDWELVATSTALYDLAFYGHELFTALFSDEKLRHQLAALEPGDGVELTWLAETDPDVPHLPLPLLYLDEVSDGRSIDPERFLGLRFRLGYNRRESSNSRALGGWQHTTRAHFMYWGKDADDQVAVEAARHRSELEQWAPLRVLTDGEPRIDNLARFLASPEPAPVALLYFYCHCDAGSGEDPQLRFGRTNGPGDVLRRPRMGSTTFADQPIVFVNACDSVGSDPLLVNQLMDGFLDRGCRAYIGTEARVPPGVAARYATTFFSFLYGSPPDRARAPVGEAVAQARRFLWSRYRNLGGLFYNFVNDYLVYAADDGDVIQLGPMANGSEDRG